MFGSKSWKTQTRSSKTLNKRNVYQPFGAWRRCSPRSRSFAQTNAFWDTFCALVHTGVLVLHSEHCLKQKYIVLEMITLKNLVF